ncbi:MAG: thioredoxin family protein [Acholeplasma sp.]|nr:thioredoxin family protein [Acholeplasma sp.]
MIHYTDDNKIQNIIDNNEKLIIVFGKGENCGVCHAVEDRVNRTIALQYPDLDIFYLTIDNSPTFRGQHLIFTVPTLLVFDRNKEIHRESRIIDFSRLERLLSLYFD